MDLAGLAAVLGVPIAIAGVIWTIAVERSQVRTLERLTAIAKDLGSNAEAADAVKRMQTNLAKRMLATQESLIRPWRVILGVILILAGVFGLGGILTVNPDFMNPTVKYPAGFDLYLQQLGAVASLSVALAGEFLAVSGFSPGKIGERLGKRLVARLERRAEAKVRKVDDDGDASGRARDRP